MCYDPKHSIHTQILFIEACIFNYNNLYIEVIHAYQRPNSVDSYAHAQYYIILIYIILDISFLQVSDTKEYQDFLQMYTGKTKTRETSN
jgi:hypothetical protein